jgi:hypothetical protein
MRKRKRGRGKTLVIDRTKRHVWAEQDPLRLSPTTPTQTRVGQFWAPVKQWQHPTLGVFAGGRRGQHEAGIYFFWTAVLKPPYLDGQKICTGRARALLPPGERFERMDKEQRTARPMAARNGNAYTWNRVLRQGGAIAYIRPANRAEVAHWARTHPEDHRSLTWLQFGPPQPRAADPKPADRPPVSPSQRAIQAVTRGWRALAQQIWGAPR